MMRKERIYSILVAVGALAVLAGCQKQTGEPTSQPEAETVNVRFNTFLKEGDNVRPLNMGAQNAAGVGTRMTAGVGTLANGFYLFGHAHTQPFATSSGNTYTPIFENVKVNPDGTYAIPKFWLQDKSLLYSFQAFAATDTTGEVGPGTITTQSSAPYVYSTTIPDAGLLTTDVLGAAVYDIKIGDEVPTVNLYFEHLLSRLSLRMQRMNAGGPTLYNLRMKTVENSVKYWSELTNIYWMPRKSTNASKNSYLPAMTSTPITLPASDMTPIEAHGLIMVKQALPAGLGITLYYTLEPGAISASNPELSLTTTLPALTLESGKQINVVIGHIVETEQIIIQSVSLTDWSTLEKNVQEYK